MMKPMWLAAGVLLAGMAGGEQQRPPNIVFVMVDDLGLYDLNCYGYKAVDTPYVNRLAEEGMLFRRAYAASTVCTPSRAGVISGKAPARLHLTNHISNEHFAPENGLLLNAPEVDSLPTEVVTFAEVLRDNGYACGFFGKWHLSRQKTDGSNAVVNEKTQPDHQGFENNVGGNGNGGPAGGWFSPYRNPYLPNGPEGEYLPERLANEAVAYMEANKNKPFLIAMWNYTVHSPLETTEALTEKYRKKRAAGERVGNPVYAGMVEAADAVLGRLMEKLDELGLRENTVVILTSDNGGFNYGVADEPPLRKTKSWLYEGGLRIPMVVRWPGKVQPGSVCEEYVSHLDYFPTFLEVAGIAPDPQLVLDGESLVPLLTGTGEPKRDALYFHYPNYAWHAKNRLGGAIIEGDYKLLNWYDDDSVELYNIKTDPSEKDELSAKHPELADRLKKKFRKWLREVDANMPLRNPDYVES